MSVTKWQQLLEGFKPLSRVALRWSNELKQIEGNLDNKHFSALRAKMAEGVTYTWLLSGRRCLIYGGTWVVSMSKEGHSPYGITALHIWFPCWEKRQQRKKAHMTAKCVLEFIVPNTDEIFPVVSSYFEGSTPGGIYHWMVTWSLQERVL